MRKILWKATAIITACVLLLAACGAQAAETAPQPINILLLACEGSQKSFTPIMPMLVTLNPSDNSLRVIYFFYQTQIETVTKKGKALSMPMNFLSYCDTAEIVSAFENTFGITADRYLIYTFKDYAQPLKAFEMLGPVTLVIAEELMSNVEFPSINEVIKMFAKSSKKDYIPLEQAGEQELDPLSCLSFLYTSPDRVWESSDRFTLMVGDYQYFDEKFKTVVEALKPAIAQMGPDTVLAFWQLLTDGQNTNITAEDIAAWSAIPFNFPDDAEPYYSVPGFDCIEMLDFDAGALTGVSGYNVKMLGYDRDVIERGIRYFLYGE